MPPFSLRPLRSASHVACAFLCAAGCNDPQRVEDAPVAQAAIVEPTPPDPYAAFPEHGLVTGTVLTVRKEPSPDAIPLGWLRRGESVRLKPSLEKTPTCQSGWHALWPRGYVCAGEGLRVSASAPPADEEERGQADREAPLPYASYLVKEAFVPEYHQVPSRDQQRAVGEYVAAWQKVVLENEPKKLEKFLAGALPGQPARPAAVRRFLDRGFYVAGTGVVVRAQRRFVRTVRGSFVKEQQLEARAAPKFAGVELGGERTLPVAWAIRGASPQRVFTEPDGSTRWRDANDVPAIPRLTLLPQWKGTTRIDGQIMHDLGDGTYLKAWFVAVAEPMAKPKEVRADEPWVHVDVGAQTLVLYVGDTPKYATLISSGVADHATPLGSFRIQRKYVSDTMSDIGADAADDRYSIDDVPWTQYFDGSRALHGAFWHTHYGIPRSHGCVNLSPNDALYVFRHTWPALPAGWHGISTQKTGEKGSLVVVTE